MPAVEGRDEGVDVHVHHRHAEPRHAGQATASDDGLELSTALVVGPLEVAVDSVKTRHPAAREPHEHGVGRERFDAERATNAAGSARTPR